MKSLNYLASIARLIPAALWLVFPMNAHSAEKTLFDFRSAPNLAIWQIVNDDVMGGVSRGTFQLTNGLALFTGHVSLENSGGFASVRSQPADHDLTGCDALLIRARGDGRRYKCTVRTTRNLDGVMYQLPFTAAKGRWDEYRLPLRQFVPTFRGRVLGGEPALDPASVTSVGVLISDKQEGPFQLEIAWIKAAPLASP